MKLILARHGNTFGPLDPVVWVGSKNDLLLVDSGREQARKLGQHLVVRAPNLVAIYASPLRRTQETAEIIAQSFGRVVPVHFDDRLTELDYGSWTGKGNAEICGEYGADVLTGWNERSEWPAGNLWPGSVEKIIDEVRDFTAEIVTRHPNQEILVVSSNGRLRYFLKLISGEFEARVAKKDFKLGTGRFAELEHKNSTWNLLSWNEAPR